jgi:phage protein D
MSEAGDQAAYARLCVSADGSRWVDVSAPVSKIDVEDHEYLTDQATIVLDDHVGLLADASFEHLRVRITLGWQAQRAEIFEGEVASSRPITQRDGYRLELTALDLGDRLKRHTPDAHSWHDGQTIAGVITDILGHPTGHGDGPGVEPGQIEPPNDVRFADDRRLLQANISDLDFIQQLADNHDCRAFVEFDAKDQKSKLHFLPIQKLATAEPLGVLDYCRGMGELTTFQAQRISAGSLVDHTTSDIDPNSGQEVEASSPPPPARPALPAPAVERRRDLTTGQRSSIEALGELAAAAEAQQVRDRQRLTTGAAADTQRTVIPDPRRLLGHSCKGEAIGTVILRAKSRVTISGVSPWAEGDWYVTKVNHVFTRQQTDLRMSTNFVSRFEGTR